MPTPRDLRPIVFSAATLLVLLAGTAMSLQPGSTPPAVPPPPSTSPAAPVPSAPPVQPAPQPGEPALQTPAPVPTTQPSTPPADVAPAGEPAVAPGQTGTGVAVPGNASSRVPDGPVVIDSLGRRVSPGEPTKLSFKQVTVEQVIPFIVESTGKVVLPQQEVLARRITLLNDKPIPRSQALDLVFLALQQTGVAVVENGDLILLRDQADVNVQNLPVLPASMSVADRPDGGAVVQKVFSLQHASAANVGEVIKPAIPDYAKLSVDADSNQLLITGPVALLQRLERVINSLDKTSAAALVTETFKLEYADADQIAQNIRDLYSDNPQANRRNTQVNQFLQQFQRGQGGPNQPGGQGQRGGQQGGGASAATTVNLRVTSNTQQNSVTVLAEQSVIDQIRRQIQNEWDSRLEVDTVTQQIFQLKNSDPIKVKAVLEGLFGSGTTGTQANQRGGAQQANQQGAVRVAGQFSFQAIPEAARLVVVARSKEHMRIIEDMIDELDRPVASLLPDIVDLKHANADDLAEQINALLAQEGTLAQIRRTSTDLTASDTTVSPFANTQSSGTSNQNQNNTNNNTEIQRFWWATARPPTDASGASNLVAKARIVPVARQNALMVMAPLEYRHAIVELIGELDKPGRQVLVSAIICEISNDDSTSLGIRFSQSAITPTKSDNTINITGTRNAAGNSTQIITGTKNDVFPNLFDTSVLAVGIDLNVLIQALNEKTKVSILSEPRIFTGDNQQAEFFDGQDIPFITNSQTATGTTALVQSFDYKPVGISLRVRPRITPERDVDLKVNLKLSSTVPGQTLFGGAIIDRRETTTQLIVKDGQTVVISGIIRAEDSDIKRKVPLLGDVPLVGLLFQSVEKSKTNTELVAFITPTVVNNPHEMDEVNNTDRTRLGVLRKHLGADDPRATLPDGTPVDQPAADPAKGPAPTQAPRSPGDF